jgi:hypothetical protein
VCTLIGDCSMSIGNELYQWTSPQTSRRYAIHVCIIVLAILLIILASVVLTERFHMFVDFAI